MLAGYPPGLPGSKMWLSHGIRWGVSFFIPLPNPDPPSVLPIDGPQSLLSPLLLPPRKFRLMSTSIPLREAKRLLRRQLRSLRDALSPDERRERSRRIFQRLNSLHAYGKAGLILFYASFGSEVNTWEMMEEAQKCGKRIALPQVSEASGGLSALEIRDLHRDLRAGYKGILEPQLDVSRQVREDEMGLIIVPGLAFDDQGYRLGYGKGYYDRFLFNFSRKVPSVGLAFDFQVVPALPVSPRDFPLDIIVTDERIIWREKPVASSGESSFQ